VDKISPAAVRYIKLGRGGAWFSRCIREGLIEFGHSQVPHEVAISYSRDELELFYQGLGRSPGKAKDFARELQDFYSLGSDCLWITIGDGRLWWAFAEPQVIPADAGAAEGRGARYRQVIGAWRDTDVNGEPLTLTTLSTRLTKVAAYRQTLCRIDAEDYLLRRINGEVDPAAARAGLARAELIASARVLIEQLTWRDFEVLVDLIFAGSGWRRASAVGGSDQADTDLVLEQAVTSERAFVQVKSKATQATLRDYVDRFEASIGYDRLFFLCHSPNGDLSGNDQPGVHIWLGDKLAEQAVKAGLFDWLLEKAR
jgi:hypothetical protein